MRKGTDEEGGLPEWWGGVGGKIYMNLFLEQNNKRPNIHWPCIFVIDVTIWSQIIRRWSTVHIFCVCNSKMSTSYSYNLTVRRKGVGIDIRREDYESQTVSETTLKRFTSPRKTGATDREPLVYLLCFDKGSCKDGHKCRKRYPWYTRSYTTHWLLSKDRLTKDFQR